MDKILELMKKKYPESSTYHNTRITIFADGSGEISSGYGRSDPTVHFEFEDVKELEDHLRGEA